MSRAFSPGKQRGEQRRNLVEAVQKHMQAAAIRAAGEVLMACLDTEVTVKLAREKGTPRQISDHPREIHWQCKNCGCNDANHFTRDGHYRRELKTGWGKIQKLQVPMLECQKCQHDVICDFEILEKHDRFWLDLDQDVLWSSGSSQSLREIAERWSAIAGNPVGLRTINERINQIESLAHKYHEQPIDDVPDVIQCDGIWMTIQEENGKSKIDKRHRVRREKKGKRVVVLVALGFWQDREKPEILDWHQASGEGHTEWEIFLNRLKKRGVTVEKGLQAVIRDGGGGLGQALHAVYGSTVVDQRCIFHKLKNVRDKCRTELKGEEHKEERKQLMQQASAVYDAETAEQARASLKAWAETWREKAPKSVETFERDFDTTIAYFQLQGLTRQWIRSTSLLERVNRQLRRKIRQALSFASLKGAEAALYLQVQRLHARWADQSWWQASHALYFDLDQTDP
jgi:Transposase, Mutator family